MAGKRATFRNLAALLAVLLGGQGCMFGVGQSLLVPPVQGRYTFNGARAHSTLTGETIVANPTSGNVAPTVTQTNVLVGWDFPRFRFSVAGGGSDTAGTSVIDFLYKHPLDDSDYPQWRLLAGFSRTETQISYQTDVRSAASGQMVRVQATESAGGWYATFGVEREFYAWLHAFVQMHGRLYAGPASDRTRSGTVADGGLEVDQQPSLSSTVNPPPFVVLAGIALTFPALGSIRRWVAGPGADRPPGLPPEPERRPESVPQPEVAPPEAPTRTQPPGSEEHPPEGWPTPDLPDPSVPDRTPPGQTPPEPPPAPQARTQS